jgi:hypothetical protein
MSTTDLTVVSPGAMVALNHSTEEVQAIIAANLGTEEISPFDLPRVGIPPGGGSNWIVPGIGGESNEPELHGVVIHHKLVRAEPPACSSPDAKQGYGDPGIACAECPHSVFGSDGKRGQACKLSEQWFLLTEGALLPLVVNLPPGSLKQAKQYRIGLAGAMLRMDEVVTSIKLDKTKNADQITYAFAVPTLAGKLDAEEATRARAYGDMMRPVLDRAPAIVTDQSGNGAEPATSTLGARETDEERAERLAAKYGDTLPGDEEA